MMNLDYIELLRESQDVKPWDSFFKDEDELRMLLDSSIVVGSGSSRIVFAVDKDTVFKYNYREIVSDIYRNENFSELLATKYLYPYLPIAPCWSGKFKGVNGIFQQKVKVDIGWATRRGESSLYDVMEDVAPDENSDHYLGYELCDGFQAGLDRFGQVVIYDYAYDAISWLRTYGMSLFEDFRYYEAVQLEV